MTTNELQAGDYVTKSVRLVRPLAEGGMGRVWIADHVGLDAQVVVKLMAPEMAERPDGAERFAREAAACAAIKSPHVVQVFDHGVTAAGPAQGTPYMVMELLEGKDLGVYLTEHGRMDPMDVVSLVVQVGKALSKAHKASIVHRDIKPENIFLCDTDGRGEIFVKLLDFGTARRDTETTSRTTVPGQIMGTPYYMSPEQSVGASEIDERTDIWSLGVVAFEALTGQKPFDGPSVGAITIAIHGALPRLTDIVPDLPPALDAWFARACAQLPQDRFTTVKDATDALVEAVTGAAPVDQPTESVFFPPVSRKGGSTPVTPVTRPIEPLIASLPERGSEKRFTTIAAGIVMAATAIAMVAIVAGRSPAVETHADAPPATQAAEPPPTAQPTSAPETKAAAAPAAPEAPPTNEAPAPAPVVEAPKKAEVAPAAKPTAPPPARTAESAREARAKASKQPPQRAARTSSPPHPKEGPDDDLVRLSNAASKHADPVESAAPAPSTPAPTPAAPSTAAPTAPAASPRPEPPPLPPAAE